MGNLVIVLSVVGSIASIVALLIAAPGKKSKIVHVVYAILITALVSSVVVYQHKTADAQREIDSLLRIEREADAILRTADRTTTGSMAGFMLASLSFLEKYKARFPETYIRAVKLCENSGVLDGQRDNQGTMNHFYSLQEASGAMEYLLKGIAASASSK
jgi:hypothetical protein